jgi:hypothetical protein
MFNQFLVHYPKGSLVTELSAIDHGKYIVRCLVQVEGTTLVTSLAAAETVELAEDKARSRAIEILGISSTTTTESENLPVAPPASWLQESPKVRSELSVGLTPSLSVSTEVSEVSEVSEVATSLKIPSSVVTQASTISESPETSDSVVLQAEQLKSEVTSNFTPTTLVVADSFNETSLSDTFSAATVEHAASSLPEASEVESSTEVTAPLLMTENTFVGGLDDAPVQSSSQGQAETETSTIPTSATAVDFSDVIAQTNVELKRLGWTNHQGRDYLVQTYGKRSRLELTNEELLDFLHHLEKLPNPD